MEDEHVHKVYEQIAHHFSSTRYKPWPKVDSFLTSRPKGAIGCDIGGGNGKYLRYPQVYTIGSDRSENLTAIASERAIVSANDVFRGDGMHTAYCKGRFDFAISIAVVHHFSTPERRIAAVKAVLETLRPQGECLIYVWALEQEKSRRGWHEGMDQDVMVPWVDNHDSGKVVQRYYHLYTKGELEDNVTAAGGHIVESGYEKDNWWCVATGHTQH